jgi:predicted NAD/FAD-dependent oxidoreductase
MAGERKQVETLIIGGGLTGLLVARQLEDAGRDVLVVDKGRGFGGRMAARDFAGARFEHGAHFLEARSSRFQNSIDAWVEAGVVEEWYVPGAEAPGVSLRYRGKPDLNALARHLAGGIEVRRGTRVAGVSRKSGLWEVALGEGESILAQHVLMTCPVPQSLDLLAAGAVRLSRSDEQKLRAITYERCFTVMAVLGGPSALKAPGILVPGDSDLDRICDHHVQGRSARPAVTIQAGHDFSLAHWECDRAEVARKILSMAERWLNSEVVDHQIHGWRYCRPLAGLLVGSMGLENHPGLFLAGDAFGGSDLEGAALSAFSAAAKILSG